LDKKRQTWEAWDKLSKVNFQCGKLLSDGLNLEEEGPLELLLRAQLRVKFATLLLP